jgi:hypothetical protein
MKAAAVAQVSRFAVTFSPEQAPASAIGAANRVVYLE